MSVSLHYEIASSEPSTAYTGLQSAKTLKTRFGSVPSAKRLRAQKRSTFPLEWSYKETYKTLSFSGLGIIPITKDFLHRFTSGAALVSLQFSKKITEIPSDPAAAFIAVFYCSIFFHWKLYINYEMLLRVCNNSFYFRQTKNLFMFSINSAISFQYISKRSNAWIVL